MNPESLTNTLGVHFCYDTANVPDRDFVFMESLP